MSLVKRPRTLNIAPHGFHVVKRQAHLRKNRGKQDIILFFVATSLCFTFISELQPWINPLKKISQTGLALTLFLIGLPLGRKELKSIQPSSLLFGISLWMIRLSASFCYVFFLLGMNEGILE